MPQVLWRGLVKCSSTKTLVAYTVFLDNEGDEGDGDTVGGPQDTGPVGQPVRSGERFAVRSGHDGRCGDFFHVDVARPKFEFDIVLNLHLIYCFILCYIVLFNPGCFWFLLVLSHYFWLVFPKWSQK